MKNGMFEIVTVDGRPRLALREGLTTNDIAELIDRLVVGAVRKAKQDRRL